MLSQFVKKPGEEGFTLIEMIIVVILMGLLAALSAPAISKSLTNLKLNTSARRLSAVLRNTRSKAIADKKNYEITFNLEEGSYSYPAGNSSKSTSLPDGITFREIEDVGNDEETIHFYPKGNSSGGKILLAAETEKFFRVEVEAISGRVKVKRGEDDY